MTSYLLDTNHISRYISLEEPLSSRIRRAQRISDEFSITVTVLGELYSAVYASRRRDDNMRKLRIAVSLLPIMPYDQLAAEEFGRIYAELKAKGRPVSPLDIQIAAVARLHGLTLLTADHHFQFVDGIVTENWLAS